MVGAATGSTPENFGCRHQSGKPGAWASFRPERFNQAWPPTIPDAVRSRTWIILSVHKHASIRSHRQPASLHVAWREGSGLSNKPAFPHLPTSAAANTAETLKLMQVEHAHLLLNNGKAFISSQSIFEQSSNELSLKLARPCCIIKNWAIRALFSRSLFNFT